MKKPGSIPLTLGLLLAVTLLAGCSVLQREADRPAGVSAKPNVWSQRMENKRQALLRETADSGISVLRTSDNELQANVPSDFSFDTDSAALKPSMKKVLDEFARDLDEAGLLTMQLRVVGHTDDRGTPAVNDPLSLARARAVAAYLAGKGIDPQRIRVEGHGEREPMVPNDMAIGRALNRRVEMFLREPG